MILYFSDGWITDNAFTVEIGTNKYDDLMKANKEVLDKVMEKLKLVLLCQNWKSGSWSCY